MLNDFFSLYIFNFVADDMVKHFMDGWFIFKYLLYRFCYNLFLTSLQYIYIYIFSVLVPFINLKGILYMNFILKKCYFILYYIFIKINRRFFRYKKRTKLYYRFGFIKPFRFLFYIYFLIILIFIWKRRTMYKNFYYIYYYLLFYFITLFIAIFIYSLSSYYYLSILFSLTFTFLIFMLCLK